MDFNVLTAVKNSEGEMLMVKKDYDEFAENPRKMCDHYTKFYTWLRRLTSPDSISDTFDTWLDNHGFKAGSNPADLISSMAKKGYVALAVYKYEHSSISYKATVGGDNPYSCNWDSCFAGVIYASRKDIRKEYGVKRVTKDVLERFYSLCQAEVEEYSAWANGDCYCYSLYEANGNIVDSIAGYYGDTEENDASALENLGVTLV